MTDTTDGAVAQEAPATEEDFALEFLKNMDGKEESTRVHVTVEPEAELARTVDDKAEEEEAPAEARAEDEGDSPEDQPNDIWANAPDTLKQAYDALVRERDEVKTKFNRERGRTSALTKKLNTLSAPASKPAQKDDRTQETINRLKEDYPEIGEVLTPIIAQVQELRGSVEQRFAAEAEQAASEVATVQEEILRERVPDYDAVLRDAGKSFWEWVDQQPSWLQSLANTNRDDLVDGDAAAEVITRFKASIGAGDPPQSQQTQIRSDPKRSRQLSGATGARPTGRSAIADPTPVTEEGWALKWLAENKG